MGRRKTHALEQIVSLLRQVEFAVASGKTTTQASKEAMITEQRTIVRARSTTACRWIKPGV